MTVVNETGQPSTADPVTADDWTWDNSPTITSRSANIGSSGTTITINGSGFNGVTGVRFGYTATYTVVNSNTITATVPVMPLGAGGTTVAVIVEIGTFTSFAAIPTADNWAWMAPAVITAMTHHTAPAGTTVTVTGTRVRRRPVRYDEHKERDELHRRQPDVADVRVPPPDANGGNSVGKSTNIRITNGSGTVSTAAPLDADGWVIQ